MRVLRVLLILQGILLFLLTSHALGLAAAVRTAMGPSTMGRVVILALAGGGFATLDVVCFIYLKKPSRRVWWAAFGVVPLAAVHIASTIALIPEDAVDVPLVIDIYLVSGVMTLAIVGALLRGTARRYVRAA